MYFNVAVAPLMNFSPAAKLLQFTLTLKTLDQGQGDAGKQEVWVNIGNGIESMLSLDQICFPVSSFAL